MHETILLTRKLPAKMFLLILLQLANYTILVNKFYFILINNCSVQSSPCGLIRFKLFYHENITLFDYF